MNILHRKDGSNRALTRRKLEVGGEHALEPIHKRRRKSLVALTMVCLAFGGTAFGYYVGEGGGSGTSHATLAAPQPVPLTISDEGSIQIATNTINYALTPCSLGSACLTTPANNPDAVWVVWSVVAPTNATFSGAQVTVNHDGSGNIISSADGNPVVGCLASWFHAGNNLEAISGSPGSFTDGGADGLPATIDGQNYFGSSLYFADDGSSQNQCSGALPELTLTLS